MIYCLTIYYRNYVALICLSEDMAEVDHFQSALTEKQEADPDAGWSQELYARPDIGRRSEKQFRVMADNGVAFVGGVAERLGIAADLRERSLAIERLLRNDA